MERSNAKRRKEGFLIGTYISFDFQIVCINYQFFIKRKIMRRMVKTIDYFYSNKNY